MKKEILILDNYLNRKDQTLKVKRYIFMVEGVWSSEKKMLKVDSFKDLEETKQDLIKKLSINEYDSIIKGYLLEDFIDILEEVNLTNIKKDEVVEEKPYVGLYSAYNPKYGDDRICKCGHPYYRHFDSYDNNYPCGCKYCDCNEFVEKVDSK